MRVNRGWTSELKINSAALQAGMAVLGILLLPPQAIRGQCEVQWLSAADAQVEDEFGGAVSVSGPWAIVGAVGTDNSANSAGSAYLFEHQASGQWSQVRELSVNDTTGPEGFGYAVSISGDVAVVGAPNDNGVGGASTGAIYIFSRNAGGPNQWGLVLRRVPNDAQPGAQFGRSVQIDDEWIVVGAPADDHVAENAGSTYLFARDHGGINTWGEVTKITAKDATQNDYFGQSVSMHGEVVVVGAPWGEATPGNSSGTAYVFKRIPKSETWIFAKKLVSGEPAFNDQFGAAVAVHGTTAFVGAPRDALPDYGQIGVAYVFERNAGGLENWGQLTKLTPSDRHSDGFFGTSISLRANFAIVGAVGNHHNGSGAGAVFSFSRNLGGLNNWGQQHRITGSITGGGESFGDSVALSEDFAFVGSHYEGLHAGAAFVFSTEAADCNANGFCDAVDIVLGTSLDANSNAVPDECEVACEANTLVATDAAEGDQLGFSVGFDGLHLVAGAPRHDARAIDAGAAYVFSNGGSRPWSVQQSLAPSDLAAGDEFGCSAAIDGSTLIVGACRDDAGGTPVAFDAGSAYIFEVDAGGPNNWGQVVKFTAAVPQSFALLGSAASLSGDHAVVGAPGVAKAFVFGRNQGGANAWGQIAQLLPLDFAEQFGSAIDLEGDTVVVGAQEDDDSGSNAGAAFVFSQNQGGPNVWGQVRKLTAGDAAPGDRFGTAVAIHGDVIVVGAPGDDNPATEAGSAYVFYRHQGGPDMWGFVIKLGAGLNAAYQDSFGISVSTHGDYIAIGAHEALRYGFNPGSVHVFERDRGVPSQWTRLGRVVGATPTVDDRLGSSVAIHGTTIMAGAIGSDFAGAYSGSVRVLELGGVDCNVSGHCDSYDIAHGMSKDCNANSIPDECEEPCVADATCDGQVDVNDLLVVIGAWGALGSQAADVNGDQIVDVNDLLAVVGAWGPCP